MHAAAKDGDAGLHCLPQECGGGCEREPGCGVFCVSAKSDCGWIFHQQDWDSVFGLYREWVSGGVSRVSSGSWGLERARSERESISTKGTASAVSKLSSTTVLAVEVRFSTHIGRSHPFPRL